MKQELIMKKENLEVQKEMVEMDFQIGDILPIAMVFIVAGIAVAYGLKVMGDVKTTMTAGSTEANATADAITGVKKFTDNYSTIVTIVVAAIIVGILLRYFLAKN